MRRSKRIIAAVLAAGVLCSSISFSVYAVKDPNSAAQVPKDDGTGGTGGTGLPTYPSYGPGYNPGYTYPTTPSNPTDPVEPVDPPYIPPSVPGVTPGEWGDLLKEFGIDAEVEDNAALIKLLQALQNISDKINFDSEDQFYPRVGNLFSINRSCDVYMNGDGDIYDTNFNGERDADEPINDELLNYYTDTNGEKFAIKGDILSPVAWQPDYAEIPDIASVFKRLYRYAVLNTDMWDTSSSSVTYEFDSASTKAVWPFIKREAWSGLTSATEKEVELKWGRDQDPDYKDKFEEEWNKQQSDKKNIVDMGSESEDEDIPWTTGMWHGIITDAEPEYEKKNYENTCDIDGKKVGDTGGETSPYESPWTSSETNAEIKITDEVFSLWAGSLWYTNTDTVVTENATQEAQILNMDMNTVSDDVKRAIKILGQDILLRDDYITRMTVGKTKDNDDVYTYGYYANSILDKYPNPDKSDDSSKDNQDVVTSPLTLDYLVQCLYRAMGKYCLRYELFFYRDNRYTVDTTSLASQITVSIDQINEAQNRVDCFVSRVGTDNYWERAVKDGLVTESGIKEADLINLPKARYTKGSDAYGMVTASYEVKDSVNDNIISCIESQKLAKREIDRNRKKVLTLAEFCLLARNFMYVYGEEVMTHKEQDILLLAYGSKLPYGIEDPAQFDAIKYLMAKGIVDSDMKWASPLQLEDLLVILSRIYDKGSRLTFKEVQITYDPLLLEQGFYPSRVNFTDSLPVTVDQIGFNGEFDFKEREWVDFVIRMSNNIEDDKGNKYSTYISYDLGDMTTTSTGSKFGLLPAGKEVQQEDINTTDIKLVETKYLGDGYKYLHFKVKRSILKWPGDETSTKNNSSKSDETSTKDNSSKSAEASKSYIHPIDGFDCIAISAGDPNATPCCWYVGTEGGVFMNPQPNSTIVTIKSKDSKDAKESNTTKYAIAYLATHSKTDNTPRYSEKVKKPPTLEKPKDGEKVKADDWETLFSTFGIVPSQVTKQTVDGYVEEYLKYKNDEGINLSIIYGNSTDKYKEFVFSDAHRSFDEVNYDASYMDYQRFLANYARMLLKNPYLDETPKVKQCFSDAEPYSITFTVHNKPGSTELIDDVYYGEIGEDNLAIAKDDPTSPINSLITFVGISGEGYRYAINNVAEAKVVQDSIHVGMTGGSVEFHDCLVKGKDTFLVNVNDLKDIVQSATYGTTMRLSNCQILSLSDDCLMISFEVSSGSASWVATRPTVFTVYISQSLHAISVNNAIYEVPENEILFYKDTSGVEPVYWVNYRAVVGWPSGYSLKLDNLTGLSGDIKVCTYNKAGFNWHYMSATNAYTDYKDTIFVTDIESSTGSDKEKTVDTFVPFTAPYVPANYVYYNSKDKGQYVIVVKNSDSLCKDSVTLDDQLLFDLETDKHTAISLLGAIYGASTPETGDYLYTVYNLEVPEYLYGKKTKKSDSESTENSDKKSGTKTKSVKKLHCFYFCEEGNYWAYKLPKISTTDTDLIKDAGGVTALLDSEFTKRHEEYYAMEVALPLFIGNNTVYNISCNILPGYEYGTVHKAACNARGGDDLSLIDQYGSTLLTYKHTLVTDADGNIVADATNMIPCPVGLVASVMSASVKASELPVGYNCNGYFGNYWTTVLKDASGDMHIVGCSASMGTSFNTFLSGVTQVSVLGLTPNYTWLNTSYSLTTLTAERQAIVDNPVRASLEDADNPPTFDWDVFRFNYLIQHCDSVLSVILIIALNVLPRIAIFLCITLLALSTITNIKPWRNFCLNVFDIYKGLTFGAATVETVNTRRLLISSIIGIGLFALFMDGTIINVLVWMTRAITGIIER